MTWVIARWQDLWASQEWFWDRPDGPFIRFLEVLPAMSLFFVAKASRQLPQSGILCLDRCQWRSRTAEIWRRQKIGHESCRPGAWSRAGDSPAQRTLDAAEGQIRWGMAVRASAFLHQVGHYAQENTVAPKTSITAVIFCILSSHTSNQQSQWAGHE